MTYQTVSIDPPLVTDFSGSVINATSIAALASAKILWPSPTGDDSDQVADALSAAADDEDIIFGIGTFTIDPFEVTKRVRLLGASKALTILQTRNLVGQHFIVLKADGARTENLTVDGRCSEQSANTGTALIVDGSVAVRSDCEIVGCIVKSAGFDAIGLWRATGCKIRGNTVYCYFDTGIDLVEGSYDNEVVDNSIIVTGKFGIALDTVDSGTYGVTRDNLIADNRIKLLAGSDVREGISIQRCEGTVCSRNRIRLAVNGKIGIRCFSSSNTHQVIENHITGNGASDSGIGIQVEQSGADPAVYTVVANNVIRSIARALYGYLTSAVFSGNVTKTVTEALKCVTDNVNSRVTVSNSRFVGSMEFAGYNASAIAELYGVTATGTWVNNGGWTLKFYQTLPSFAYNDGTIKSATIA